MDWNKYIIYGDNDIIKNTNTYYPTLETKNEYHNILLTTPFFKPNTFHSILAIEYNTKKYIPNSNSYIRDATYNIHYELKHQIYNRINMTYALLSTRNINECVMMDDECLLLANPFSGVNSGHDLSVILNALQYYLTNNMQCKVVIHIESFVIPRNIELIELFIPRDKFIIINYDKYYFFKNIHIPKPIIFDIFAHKLLINKLKKSIITKMSNSDEYKNKKIVLIKNMNNLNIVRKENCYQCSELFTLLEKNGWIIINPEKMHIYKIAMYIMFANKIFLSGGAIAYTHVIYMDDKISKIYFVAPVNIADSINCELAHKCIFVNDTNLDTNKDIIFTTINNSIFNTDKMII